MPSTGGSDRRLQGTTTQCLGRPRAGQRASVSSCYVLLHLYTHVVENNYAEAKEALQKIFRQLERINPSAARSLEEGLEETLTVHRLGIGAVLRRKLATTNPIESCLSTVQRVARNVKRWREGNQPLRWTATGLLEAEKKFRRIKGYQEILLLKERLNPSRIQQKEVRSVEVA